jgi:hypothetical protein
MKTKKFSKRLALNKKTIANLSGEMQKLVKGGDFTCPGCGYTCPGYETCYTCGETCGETCPATCTYATCDSYCDTDCAPCTIKFCTP